MPEPEEVATTAGANGGTQAAPEGERRTHKRKGVQVNKLIRGTIQLPDEPEEETYLYLVDLSEGGMRLNMDRFLPENKEFRLQFTLDNGRTFDCKLATAWQKCMTGGTWVAGVEFREPSQETRDVVAALLKDFSIEGKRMRFRLKAILSVTVRRPDDPMWYNVTALDLSVEGLQFNWDEPIDPDTVLDFNIFPDNLPAVEGQMRIVWQRGLNNGRWQFGAQFLGLSEAHCTTLQRYIDKQVGAA